MQWTFICILLASIAIISASDHGNRSKRDLSFIKSYILSKIFGNCENDTTPLPPKPVNYRLFRVPGFDNILVKAVPKVPVVTEIDAPPPSVIEGTESAPIHPIIAIVSNYLGTNKLNDTLFALRGVKDLLQSGVLTAKREGIDKIAAFKHSLPSVMVESSEIVVDEAQRPFMVYPSLGETIVERYSPVQIPRYPNLPIPSKYSYKQVNSDGVISYTAHDNQNVMVTESKRPIPFPSPISGRIQDILSMGIYRLPTSPVMHKRVKTPAPISVFEVPKFQMPYQKVKVMPSHIPSGYSYNQVHNDGSMTTYSGSGHVQHHEGDIPVVISEVKNSPISVVVTGIEGPAPIPVFNAPKVHGPFPVKVPSHSSGHSHNHIHNDGSMTTYSGSGHVVKHEGEKLAVVITEPGRPTVVVADAEGPPAPFPVFNVPKVKVPSGSGYSYNHINNDGSITTYSGSGKVVEHEGRKPAVVITEPGRPTVVVTDVEGPPAPFPVFNAPNVKVPSSPGYSYNHVHGDGSVTTYSGSGHVVEHEGRKPAVVITEPGRPTVVVSDVERSPAPIPAFNRPNVKVPSSPGYSYNHVHGDGSVTTYSGSGHVVEHEGRKPAVVITEPGRPTVVVSDVEGPPAPFPVFNAPNVKVPYGSGYSYNHVRNDGSVTTYSGSGHIVEHEGRKPAVVITEPGRPSVVVSDLEGPPAPFPVFNRPNVKVPSGSGYSYNHVRNDGSVTSYSGSGQVVEHVRQEPAVVITEPGRPTVVVSDVEGPPAPFPVFNAPNVKVPYGSRYSYNHVRNDGSVTTYSGSGQVAEHVGQEPAVVITEPGRPTVVVPDVEGPPAPFPVFNAPNVQVPYGSGYSYNHVRNDGSVTTYSGSGQVAEHVGQEPAVVITEPGRPTVVVPDVEGPPAPFPVFNAPNVQVPYGSGYSYNHVRNDGSVTTYSGSGQVVEHEGQEPAVLITEPGRPTVVVSDAGGPPAPIPVFNRLNVNVPSGPGYSYNHVHGDGSVTTYSGSGHIVEHEGRKPDVVITEPGRPTVVVSDVEGPPAPFPVFSRPNVKVPSSSGYSYNHVHDDGSVITYSGSGHVVEHEGRKPAVVITEPGRPTVVVSDVEGPPAPFPVFNRPNVKVPSSPGYSYNHVRNDGSVTTYSGSRQVVEHEAQEPAIVITEPGRPTVVVSDVEGPPAPFPVGMLPKVKVPSGSGYSYNHVHNDGSMTMYSGSGKVKEHQGEISGVVVTETRRPLALPTFLTNRIENVAATAMGVRLPNNSYGPPAPVPHEHPVIVEERPDFVYHVKHNPYQMPHRPNYGEQVKVNFVNNSNEHSRPTSNVPSGFSYKTVHEDGSVTSYTDAGVVEGTHAVHDRPILYPTGPAAPHVNDNVGKDHAKTEKCKDPAHLHAANKKGQSHNVVANNNLSNFSYTTISEGSSTTYSGSGHVHNKIDTTSHVDVTPIIANAPLLVTHTDKDNPEKVRLTPVLSQYSYKQINHHKPDNFTVVNVGDVPVGDGQVVQVSSPAVSSTSELQSVEVSEVPKDYVFMPPSTTEEPVPTKKSVEVSISSTKKAERVPSSSKKPLAAVPTSTKISHSFKPKRVYRHRVRTSTSSSSTRVLKTSAPLSTTPKGPSSNVETSSEGSLSANPIVVLPEEKVFSFKQDRADGSSITVVGNKENKVSVVEEPKTPNRGDIPDSTF